MPQQKTIIIGLSGPSSSGKTTLARLLRGIYDVSTSKVKISLSILHEDDFYKTDKDIPVIKTASGRELQDWDCAESIDLPLLQSALQHIHDHGTLPPSLFSKEDQNAVGPHGVPDSTVESLKSSVRQWADSLPVPVSDTTDSPALEIRLFILDGFLLYSNPQDPNPPMPHSLTSLLDIKLFLRSTAQQTISRRAARTGYVTLEGFWADPPGYVEELVWPNYVRDHAWMFEGGDVDHGAVREDLVTAQAGIRVGPGKGDQGLEPVLKWAAEILNEGVEGVAKEVGKA